MAHKYIGINSGLIPTQRKVTKKKAAEVCPEGRLNSSEAVINDSILSRYSGGRRRLKEHKIYQPLACKAQYREKQNFICLLRFNQKYNWY